MKKNIIIGVSLLVIGIVGGVLLCRAFHHDKVEVVQKDTIVMHDTIRYSRLELDYETVRLDLPKIGKKEYVFIVEDSTTIIYRDSVRYVTALREFFYTRTPEVEIWHSGIDSRIDSLNVYPKTMYITSATRKAETWRFSLDVGADMGKGSALYLSPNLSAEIGYKRWSVTGEIGISVEAENRYIQRPYLYYQAGLRYNLYKR